MDRSPDGQSTPIAVSPTPAVMAPAEALPPANPRATEPSAAAGAVPGPAPTSSAPPAAEPSGFTTPVIVCLVLAGLSLIATFSSPSSLLGVALFGGYAYYLYNGGRDITAVAADGGTRARAWTAWGGIAALALIVGFTWAPALVLAFAAGLYAAYLFNGGRDVTREAADGRRRSAVWMYYAAIGTVSAAFGFSQPGAFLLALAAGAYATYLFRGGRWILWIW